MNPMLQSAWNEYEKSRAEFLTKIAALPSTEVVPSGAWTPAGLLDHLAQVDAMYLALSNKPRAKGLKAKRGFLFKMLVGKMAAGSKMPNMGFAEPRTGDYAVAKEAFNQNQAGLFKLYQTQSEPNEALMKHPLFGPIGGLELIELQTAHLAYHRRQLHPRI